MDIYKYYHNTKEWHDIVNSDLKGIAREDAFRKYIKETGEPVSIQDNFKDYNRNNWRNDYSYQCFGEAQNCIERLVNGEIDFDEDLSYCDISSRSPEDLIESRTDWDDMKSYADGLEAFISALKSEIANGTIVLA